MSVIETSLTSELLKTFRLKTKTELAAVLGTSSSTITDLTQNKAGRTMTNSCILVNEIAKELTPTEIKKVLLKASEQYRR